MNCHRVSALALATLVLGGAACADSVPTAPLTAPVATKQAKPKLPKIGGVALSSTTVPIGGAAVAYTVALPNQGPAVDSIIVQGEIVQGAVTKGAGGLYVQCGGTPGFLPTGTCAVAWSLSASGDVAGGALVPGPATFRITLYDDDNVQATPPVVLDVRNIAITLVADAPIITSLVLGSTDIQFGVGTTYTVELLNPTGAVISLAGLQGYIDQGAIVDTPAGGTSVSCGAGTGVLPPGTCRMSFTVNPSGSYGLSTGAATFRLEFFGPGGTVFDTVLVAITLYPFQT
jgi:hypothetical protein